MYAYRKMSPQEKEEILRSRRQAGNPLHEIPHLFKAGGWFLITAATYEHIRYFDTDADREQLRTDLLEGLHRKDIHCTAWVFLPDHYHLLVECYPLSILGEPLRRVHARTARRLNLLNHTEGRKIWYRYSDRLIRDENHFYTTLNYIHFNPVKHGYCDVPEKWESSSYGWYIHNLGTDWLLDIWGKYPLHSYNDGWFEKMDRM